MPTLKNRDRKLYEATEKAAKSQRLSAMYKDEGPVFRAVYGVSQPVADSDMRAASKEFKESLKKKKPKLK